MMIAMHLRLAAIALLFSSFYARHHAAATPLPNVVFILADDLGWGEIGAFGQTKIPTPHLDELAKQGMRLTQHYSGAPVCAPSRCVLLTGKHLGRAEIRGNSQAKKFFPEFDEGQYPLSASAITFPMLFQQAGYATAAMGKWGLGPVGSTGEPNRKGFDLFFGYNCQAVAHSFYPAYLWRNREKVPLNNPPIPGHFKQPSGEVTMEQWIGKEYAPHRMVAEAEQFIRDHQQQPFFLYLPFTEPHVAMHPPRESVSRFPTAWDQTEYRGLNGYLPHPRPRAAYAAMIHDLDSYVGRILRTLSEHGLREQTLIIFSSDNGSTHPGPKDPNFHIGGADPVFFNSTAGLRGYKGSVYEGGIRVPTIACWPGKIPAGTASAVPSYFADWFPTLCEALQFQAPDALDGQSLWPVLTGLQPLIEKRPPMIWVFPEYGGQLAIRLGDFKLVRQGLNAKQPGPWEVYNLAADIGEKNNLANQHPMLIAEAEQILRQEVSENRIFPLTIPAIND
jgi:arylsulfatase A